MTEKMNRKLSIFVGGVLFAFMVPFLVSAFEITTLADMPVEGDFVLGPGKAEIYLDPGEEASRDLQITNRAGHPLKVTVEIEDFKGTRGGEPSMLLGEERGPYSLKDYLFPEKNEFILVHGEKATLPVKISIPSDAEPGGRYGAVIIRTEPMLQDESGQFIENQVKGQIKIVSRLATLFFVRINGNANTNGEFKGFDTDKSFYQGAPVMFSLIYENNGSVHLVPYATIEISNAFGKKIDRFDVEPWFVMPDSSRSREIKWDRTLLFGRYVASAKMNLGYGEKVEEKRVVFWVLPWRFLIVGISATLLLAFVIWWISTHVEIKRK